MTEALDLQPGLSDGDLVRSAADGDRQAFAELYDRYADRLYDFCIGLIGDRDAAADCVQDTFCVAATDLGSLREPDKLRPWLYSIARHHALRRLRHRYREEASDELPDMVSHDASPETLAGQSELARLVAEAAGGLSDRDRELLDLSYRHGLDGPELAETLGVTLNSANTMMFRLRQTVERCLGALLVARGVRANPDACPELAASLKGWDGQFSVLMRKRLARHIDSCPTCEQDQRRHVNPVALLGSTAVFIPAPDWLRRQTLDRVQLTCASSGIAEASDHAAGAPRIQQRRMALVVGVPLVCLGLSITWFAGSDVPVVRVVDTGADSSARPVSVPPAVKNPPAMGRPVAVPVAGAARPSAPVRQAEPTPTPGLRSGAAAPGRAPAADTPGPAPVSALPGVSPGAVPGAPRIDAAPIPDSDPKATAPGPEVDTAPGPNPNGATGTTAAVDTVPATNPKGTTTNTGVNTTSIPNPNLNPKVVSSYPQTNTATISNPNATSPNLQTNIAPKTNTNTTTNTKTTTNTNTTTNTKTTTNTNTTTKTTNGGSGSGSSIDKNTNTSSNSKTAGSAAK